MKLLVALLFVLLVNAPFLATTPADTFAREQSDAAATWQLSTHGYPLMGDYSGRYFNHTGGVRLTTDQPLVYHSMIYLFGNSVMYGYTVMDADTIASAVQRLDRADRIVNLGVLGGNTTTALAHLQTLSLRPGDTVVWLMGIEESRAIYYAEEGQTPSAGWLNIHLAAMRDTMQRDITAGASYARARHARFIWILQPYLWSMPVTTRETFVSVPDNLKAMDVAARPIQQALRLPAVDSYDFTDILNAARRAGVALYDDHIHLNAKGNALLARAIYDMIRPVF